jgi:hypothetical protein
LLPNAANEPALFFVDPLRQWRDPAAGLVDATLPSVEREREVRRCFPAAYFTGKSVSRTRSTDELNRVGEPHGIRFLDDWIPDLKAAYDPRVIGE